MVDELLEPKALHLTRSLKRNLLITTGMDLTFSNKTMVGKKFIAPKDLKKDQDEYDIAYVLAKKHQS